MTAVEHFHQLSVTDNLRLCVGFFQPRNHPRLFTFQGFCGKLGLLYDAAENVERLLALPRAAQGPKRHTRTIGVEIRAELSANVSKSFGNLVFGQTSRPQVA